MLTPQKIQDLADPIEGIYINVVNELMVNIGSHITSPAWTHTASWEVQKLSEMGQLTKENAAIINKWIKEIPDAMRTTMEATRAAALDDLEKQMEKAVSDGYLTPPASDSSMRVFEDLSAQAADQLNLVNTTMLQSSLRQYNRMIMLTEENVKRAERTQEILNEAATSVATATETRTQALQRAIRTIAEEGLTGFYDKAGRSWTPEAYVNMDIRTTVHNAAVQSTKQRMSDYGVDVFQISSHAGARPLCAPYQGWFCSWGGEEGEIELGDGRFEHYVSINETSYGEPAGIFGINCGHFPIPIVPGYTIPHGADNILPPEENERIYKESQEQRRLEREIRAAKRVVAMGDDSKEAKQAIRDAQEKMRQFIDKTGRTRRYDREQIVTSTNKDNQPKQQEKKAPVFTPAKTIEEAEKFADRFVWSYKTDVSGKVNYSGININYANEFNRALNDVVSLYKPSYTNTKGEEKEIQLRNILPINKREKRFRDTTADAAYQWGIGDLFYNKDIYKTEKAFRESRERAKETLNLVLKNIDILEKKYNNDNSSSGRSGMARVNALKNTGRFNVSLDAYGTMVHELGHYLDDTMFRRAFKEKSFNVSESYEKYSQNVSGYATENNREYVAESFTAFMIGERKNLDPDLVKIFTELQK